MTRCSWGVSSLTHTQVDVLHNVGDIVPMWKSLCFVLYRKQRQRSDAPCDAPSGGSMPDCHLLHPAVSGHHHHPPLWVFPFLSCVAGFPQAWRFASSPPQSTRWFPSRRERKATWRSGLSGCRRRRWAWRERLWSWTKRETGSTGPWESFWSTRTSRWLPTAHIEVNQTDELTPSNWAEPQSQEWGVLTLLNLVELQTERQKMGANYRS